MCSRRDDGLRLSRRYWGDEMSSCIEIYCLHLLNSANYLPCLQNYCPDAVVAVLPKRQALPDEQLSPPSSLDGQVQRHFVTCPDADRRRAGKYCVGFVCRQVFSGMATLDVATSRCALLHCSAAVGVETDYERCVADVCC